MRDQSSLSASPNAAPSAEQDVAYCGKESVSKPLFSLVVLLTLGAAGMAMFWPSQGERLLAMSKQVHLRATHLNGSHRLQEAGADLAMIKPSASKGERDCLRSAPFLFCGNEILMQEDIASDVALQNSRRDVITLVNTDSWHRHRLPEVKVLKGADTALAEADKRLAELNLVLKAKGGLLPDEVLERDRRADAERADKLVRDAR